MERRFEIVITGTEHHTWQGVLCDGEERFAFRSELELLLELDRRLGGGHTAFSAARGGDYRACRQGACP